jgi:serpin B
MGRGLVLLIGMSIAAASACGAGDGQRSSSGATAPSTDVTVEPPTDVTVDPPTGVTVAPPTDATVAPSTDVTVPGSEPAAGAEPEAEALSLRFGSLTERQIDIDADGRNTTAAVTGMNQFATDLYTAVASGEPGNVVVSPYSVTFTLSMIYAGAEGATATEMAAVLHAADVPGWQEGINAYDLTLDARTSGSPTSWSAGNKVWTRPGLALREEYLDVLTGVYGSPLAEADFATDADAERRVINGWVEGRTNDLIPELFPDGSLDASTAMVLVNAVALDAPWEFPFDPGATRVEPFTRSDGSTVDVDMMHYDEFLPSGGGETYQAVELPYGGGALSMVVIMPNDLAEFEASLTTESLDAVFDSITDGGIHLSLPKWSARTHLTLNDTLAAMGMPTAFGSGADFSGMVDGGGLWLDLVEHEAFVEVDEQGTRAAAATGGAMAESHGPTIAINRPFLYVIRDRGAGTILFIGRIDDPTQTP